MSTDAELLATIGRAPVSQRDVSKILREVCGLAVRLWIERFSLK